MWKLAKNTNAIKIKENTRDIPPALPAADPSLDIPDPSFCLN